MKAKVYLESTVISVLAARPSGEPTIAAMQEWTHRWWNEKRTEFDLFVSDYVLDEISRGDREQSAKRRELISEISFLASTKTARRLARKLARVISLPASARTDAFHIAIAIEGGIDFLLTWNCAHIANPFNQRIIRKMAKARMRNAPLICSPREFLDGAVDATRSD